LEQTVCWHGRIAALRSVEATATQVVGNDYISNSIKDKLDVVSVGGTSLVAVDLFRRALVLRLELCLDVSCCFLVALLAYITSSSSSSSSSSHWQ